MGSISNNIKQQIPGLSLFSPLLASYSISLSNVSYSCRYVFDQDLIRSALTMLRPSTTTFSPRVRELLLWPRWSTSMVRFRPHNQSLMLSAIIQLT
jgi:hypothetical protein